MLPHVQMSDYFSISQYKMYHIINELISSQYHLYASVNRVSFGSDNSLSTIWRQDIINAGLLSIETLGTNLSEIIIKI